MNITNRCVLFRSHPQKAVMLYAERKSFDFYRICIIYVDSRLVGLYGLYTYLEPYTDEKLVSDSKSILSHSVNVSIN